MDISHSAINEYLECSEKFRLNRIEKIRPTTKSSAFIFGGALDDAAEAVLLKKGKPLKAFYDAMMTTEINGVKVSVPQNKDIKYFSKDLQVELIQDSQWEDIKNYGAGVLQDPDFDPVEFLKKCVALRKKKKALGDMEQTIFNFANFFSLCNKGKMLIEKFQEWAVKNIDEVIEVQKRVSLVNESGDELRGFLDFKAKFKDGVVRIVDLKTASDPKRQYPDGCADTAQQLAIYAEIEEVYDVAYYILDKNIRKKEPRVRDRFITGHIDELTGNEIFDNIEESLVRIKRKEFEHNWDACNNYGGCPYRSFCKSGGQNMQGLVQLKRGKDGN
jgi:hypothetical protein